MSELTEALLVAYSHFRRLGYADAGLLLAAALVIELTGRVDLARKAVEAFEQGRTFYGDDVDVLRVVWNGLEVGDEATGVDGR